MTDTDTVCGLNRNIVAKAEPNPERPNPEGIVLGGILERKYLASLTKKEHSEGPWI